MPRGKATTIETATEIPLRAKLMVLNEYQVQQRHFRPGLIPQDQSIDGDAWHVGVHGDDRGIVLSVERRFTEKSFLNEELGKLHGELSNLHTIGENKRLEVERFKDLARNARSRTVEKGDADEREAQALEFEKKADAIDLKTTLEAKAQAIERIKEITAQIVAIEADTQEWRFPVDMPGMVIQLA